MAFTVKDWRDDPDASTPLSAAALENLETRLSGYTDSALTSGLAGKANTSHTHAVADLGSGTPASGKYLDGAGAWTTLPSAQSGHTIQDEGSDLTARQKLNFIGAGVTVTDNSGTGASDVTITGAAASDASTSTKGVVTLSKSPASPTAPIALGANERGAASGVASLDSTSRVPVAQIAGFGGTLIAPAPSGDTTGATDTTAIQALMDQAATAGSGMVWLRPAPTTAPYYVTQLKLRTRVQLVGASMWGTVLKAPIGQVSGRHMIVLNDDLTYGWGLRDLCLDGQNGKGPAYGGSATPVQANAFHGINIDVTTGINHFDPYANDMTGVIADVAVVQMPHRGVVVARATSEIRMRGVYVLSCRYSGFQVDYADCFLSDCTAGSCGSIGFRVTGSVVQLSNCKAFWNGWGGAESGTVNADFYVTSRGNQLSNCFSQDAYVTGFYIKGNEHRIDGSVAGGNTQNLMIDTAVDCHISLTSNQQINNQTADYLLNNAGSSSGNQIVLDGKAGATVANVTGSSLSGNDVQVYGTWVAGGPVSSSSTPLIPAVFPESASFFMPYGLIASGNAGVENQLAAIPIVLGRDTTISEFDVKVNTAGGASSTCRIGVYADTGSFYPGAKLLDAGTVATATTGVKTLTGLSLALTKGTVYWFVAVVSGGGGTVPVMAKAAISTTAGEYMGGNNSNSGYVLANQVNDAVAGFSQAGVTGALPSTFTTTRTAEVSNTSAGGTLIAVVAKAA